MSLQTWLETLIEYPLALQMLILAILGLLLAFVGRWILVVVLRASRKRVDSYITDIIIRRAARPVFWVIALAAIVVLWGGLPAMEERPLILILGVYSARTLLYIAAASLLVRGVDIVSDVIRHRFNINNNNNLAERKILTQLQYIRKIAVIAIVVVAIAFILLQFDSVRSLGTGLLTASGVTGIVIAFAAQKSIANLLAGFQIAFTQPIRLDDALNINGEFGRVEEITLTYVTLKLWDERRMVVPLQYFIDNPFQNWTRSSSQLVGTVLLHVDFRLPLGELRAEVDRFLPTQELWDERVKNVQVTDLTDRVMTVRVLVSSVDSGSTFTLRCIVREHLITFIRENYPHCLPQSRVTSLDEGLTSAGSAGQPVTPAMPD